MRALSLKLLVLGKGGGGGGVSVTALVGNTVMESYCTLLHFPLLTPALGSLASTRSILLTALASFRIAWFESELSLE